MLIDDLLHQRRNIIQILRFNLIRSANIALLLILFGACNESNTPSFLTEPNISYSACLAGNAPCPEICNGEDDDKDGVIDESLDQICLAMTKLSFSVGQPEDGFGRSIAIVPDLNHDGYEEVLVSSSRSLANIDPQDPLEGKVSLLLGGTLLTSSASEEDNTNLQKALDIEWTVKYGGDFGHSIVVGNLDGRPLWCAGAPTNEGPNGVIGKILCLDFEGQVIEKVVAESEYGLGQYMTIKKGDDKDTLLVSEPLWSKPAEESSEMLEHNGRILQMQLTADGWIVENSFEGTKSEQKIGERVLAIADANQDQISDLLITGYEVDNRSNRQVWIISGQAEGSLSRIKRFSTPENTDGSFGASLAIGRFDQQINELLLAFGAPYVESNREDTIDYLSRLYFTTIEGEPLGTNSARILDTEEQGLGEAMAKIPLGDHELLVTSGPGLLRVLQMNAGTPEVIQEFSLPRGSRTTLAASQKVDADGLMRVWIGLPDLGMIKLMTVRLANIP